MPTYLGRAEVRHAWPNKGFEVKDNGKGRGMGEKEGSRAAMD